MKIIDGSAKIGPARSNFHGIMVNGVVYLYGGSTYNIVNFLPTNYSDTWKLSPSLLIDSTTGSPVSSSSNESKSGNNSAVIAIAVVIPAVVIVIASILVFFFTKR